MMGGNSIINRGVEQYILNLIRNIDHGQFNVDVLTPFQCENGNFSATVETHGGKVIELCCTRNKLLFCWQFVCRISSLLKEEHYDIVELQTGSLKMLCLGAMAARKYTDALILHTHNTHLNSQKHKLQRLLFCGKMKCADRFYACSHEAGIDTFPESVYPKIEVIPNAIDVAAFRFDESARKLVREELEIEDKFVIGHVGAFTEQKNHKFLLDVFEKVVEKNPESVLLLIGEGNLRKSLEWSAEERGLISKVIFYGTSDCIPALLSAMDVFVFPSLWEGLGIAVVEAQANGLPCVCSAELPEEVRITSHYHRLQLDTKADEWADVVLRVGKDRMNKDLMIEANRTIEESCFNAKQWIKMMETKYREI